MDRSKTCVAALVALLCASALALADASPAQKKPNYGFDRMKALGGAWQGAKKDGKRVKVRGDPRRERRRRS